jgi:hypothetical protein
MSLRSRSKRSYLVGSEQGCNITRTCYFTALYCLVYGFCMNNNNNGLWIEWLDLLALPLQLQPIITAHNQWLPKTRSIPYRTTSVFSSTVTDLVLIYESVTSSASVVRCLTLHSWTLNLLTADEWLWNCLLNSLTTEWIIQWIHEWTLFYNSGRTEERPPPRTFLLLLFMFYSLLWNLPDDFLPSNGGPSTVDLENTLTESLSSNGHIHHNTY